MNKSNLKKCFSLFATGITSIITKDKKMYIGITVNSFGSVSLEPPLVMWCINKKSSSINSFISNKKDYSIIFLSNSQKKISNRLAGSDNKLQKIEFEKIKRNSLGFINCELHKKISAGDHFIIIHKVKNYKLMSKKKPLIFFNSKYN